MAAEPSACPKLTKGKMDYDFGDTAGMTPHDEAPEMAYGRAQMRESMTFDKFVKHIAEHNGVFSRGTVQGVILDMCECLVEMLLDGKL